MVRFGDVKKYGFEDYCGLSFIRRCKFLYLYSFLNKKKNEGKNSFNHITVNSD